MPQLGKALQVEIETTAFYRKMVAQLPDEGRKLFARFLEIEENHIEAVQFEMDFTGNTGYWFNMKEFDME
jgi:rubrerythrin